LNYEPIIESVKKTGRVVLSSDACQRGSFLNDVAQNISELAFDYLDAPPVVIGSRNWITPAYELEKAFFPQPEWFLDAIHERILPLNGYTPTTNTSDAEKIRLSKLGI
jgi:2-oxoisovalerate dehydrogenase E1 component